MKKPSRQVVVAVVISAVTVGYGARAAAFMDFGGDVILADLLANSMKQLTVATESLAELRRSYAEVRKVADYADDAANAARSFQGYSAQRFGDRFLAELDAVRPDIQRYRSEALGALGMKGSEWTQAQVDAGKADGVRVLDALRTTFGAGAGAAPVQATVVDAEVAAAIQGDAAQAQVATMQKERVQELLRRCNGIGDVGSARDAKRVAEECRSAAEQAQLLQLEEGQQANLKLSQIARLHAVGVEQKNADLKRELAEQQARRQGLTEGFNALSRQSVSIRAGGFAP
jgi:hypothetical protein